MGGEQNLSYRRISNHICGYSTCKVEHNPHRLNWGMLSGLFPRVEYGSSWGKGEKVSNLTMEKPGKHHISQGQHQL